MAITAGQTGVASDFKTTSAGSADSGKVPKLDANGRLDGSFLRGGTGADGAFSQSAGATNYDLAGAAYFVKNFTSFSLTGSASITFTNPHANGTIIIFKVQGNTTLNTSATRAIDLRSLGATGDSLGNTNIGTATNKGAAGATGGSNTTGAASIIPAYIPSKIIPLCVGGGGGTGSSAANGVAPHGGSGGGQYANAGSNGGTGTNGTQNNGSTGAGGRGSGAMLFEVGGTYSNTTSTIDFSGGAGGAGDNSINNGAGGGGAGGCFVVRAVTIGTDTGTYTSTGGAAGAVTTAGAAGAGAAGYTDRAVFDF